MLKRLLFLNISKFIIPTFTLVLVNLCFFSTAFAAKKVTGVTYGSQVGTATSGTGTSVTYTMTLSESGSSAPSADNISLTWAGGTPTGVTWNFTSSTETSFTGANTTAATFKPSGNSTATITFTVTTSSSTPAGTYGFTLVITDNNSGGGPYTSSGLSLVVNPPAPVISYSPSTNVYVQGTAISALTPTNTGGAATSWSISPSLPAGLSFSTSTGVISGTPTATSSATAYTVTATNAGGSGTTTVNITVNPQAPNISYSPATNVFTAGTAISSWTPTNSGGAATSWSISPALSAGLLFNTSTGVISGTPTSQSFFTIYTITATNVTGSSSFNINITVNNPAPPNISYSPSTNTYVVGTAISTLTPSNTGGTVVSYAVSPSLPAGLSLNTSTGVISGTPTAVTATATYTVTATNTGGSSSATLTLTVNPQLPAISYSPSTNSYPINTAISSLTPTNTGGAAANWSISTALPAGLSFDTTTGIISGTPTTVTATATYTVTATNVTGSATTTVTITVTPQPPIIGYSPSANIYVINTAITNWIPTNTGGTSTSWSISPSLPAGLSFDTTTGTISGTPTALSAITTYTVTATNAGGSCSATIKITVNPSAPVISYTPSSNNFIVGSAVTTWTPTNTGGGFYQLVSWPGTAVRVNI